MTHDSARGWFTAALAISLLTALGCGSERPGEDPSLESSSIGATGRVCSSNDADDATECLPAECGVFDRCLRCVDPKGRVAVDCSIDYETLRTGSSTIRPGSADSMASCSFMWGVASASGTTCHYPGTTSCVVTEEPGWHCLQCTYPDGSGSGICNASSEPLPDPLIGRPDDLPPPGNCVSEIGKDGLVSCATCTHDDLSAERSCLYPGVIACHLGDFDDWKAGCMGRCTLDDGSEVRLCNSERGPRPVPLSGP